MSFELSSLTDNIIDNRPAPERLSDKALLEILENYINYYASGEGHTARAKRYDLKYFIEFLANGRTLSSVQVSHWTLQITKDFIDARLSLGESPATVSRRLATLKHFGRTLAERVPGFINPAREVKSPTVQQTKPSGLAEHEVNLLREAAEKEVAQKKGDFISVRNRFLLELLLATGLRADEVRLLTINQIIEDRSWFKNVKTKGRKFRNVYIQESLRGLLEEYLSKREEELTSKFPGILSLSQSERNQFPLLISVREARLTVPGSFGLAPKTIWRIVAGFGAAAAELSTAKVPNLHPHKLRHTFAHGLLDSSRDVRLVAQALGHSDVRTTMRYTERAEEEIARAIEMKDQN